MDYYEAAVITFLTESNRNECVCVYAREAFDVIVIFFASAVAP